MNVGDRVSWETAQGHTQGTVIERHTEDFRFADADLVASADHPVYIVESEKSHEREAHRSSALRKLHNLHA